MPEPGDVVDEVFRVEEVIGEGSFGALYRVRDLPEDRPLALKVQKTGSDNPDEIRARFEREARLLYSLDHVNVVDLLYYGETEHGLPYMAMEFLEGNNLAQLLAGGFDFHNGQIERVATETLLALAAAHELGIVHRDVKPANIFLADEGDRGIVKVVDFGFAKAIDNDEGPSLTRKQTVLGSPPYMSPEMAAKESVGPHSDLYGLGLIIGEMIVGERLVQFDNAIKAIAFHKSDEPVDLPDPVERSPFGPVVAKAVRKDPQKRYRSAEAMLTDLRDIDPHTDR